jgi:hypothetical protein
MIPAGSDGAGGAMAGFTGFITYKGKQLYLIDIEGLTPDQVVAVVPVVERDVRARPTKSVCTLLNVKGVRLDPKMNERLKLLAAGNEPYVKASAIVGLAALQRVVLVAISIFSRREFKLFDSLDAAKEYLVGLP